jgi:hypothetical protein
MALVNMTQEDVLSMEVLSPQTFCPHGCFVRRTFCLPDVLSAGHFVHWTFCPYGRFVRRMFCLYGCFVPKDILSLRTFCPRTFCLQTFCLRTFCLGTLYTVLFCVCLYICTGYIWNFFRIISKIYITGFSHTFVIWTVCRVSTEMDFCNSAKFKIFWELSFTSAEFNGILCGAVSAVVTRGNMRYTKKLRKLN